MKLNLEESLHKNSRYLIGEVGLNHNGEISRAAKIIEVAAKNKFQAVKFQKRDIDQLANKETLESQDSRFPIFGKTYGEIRRYLEFNPIQLKNLRDYSYKLGLDFFITPFDIQSLKAVDDLELPIIKVASHSVTNLDLLKEIAKRNKYTILSSGMCDLKELDLAVEIILKSSRKTILLHCVSSYPTFHYQTNLDLIDFYRKRYGVSVGYSGHEADFEPTVVAYAKGAKIIERHITLNKSDVGFDHKLSLNNEEMKELSNRLDYIDEVSGDGLKILRDYELVTRDKYRVSMIAKRDLNIGETLQINDISWKNPGTGIPRIDLEKYLGRKVLHFIPKDKLIELSDFEPS